MAGFITFDMESLEKTWSSANWVFVGFLDHVLELDETDVEVNHELTVCKHHQSVNLGNIAEENPGMCNHILDAFNLACTQIAEDNYSVSVNGNVLEQGSQTQFKEAISELKNLLDREGTRNA